MRHELHYDYTTVGHVTVDVSPTARAAPGGSAFYSALQAARLGLRTLIVTQGVPHEIEALLAPYLGELELRSSRAPHDHAATRGSGADAHASACSRGPGPISSRSSSTPRSCTWRPSHARRRARAGEEAGFVGAHAAGARARSGARERSGGRRRPPRRRAPPRRALSTPRAPTAATRS